MPQLKRFVIDTLGATAPELISSALATHPHASVLPGLAFVRDDLRLYRPHRLDNLTAAEIFDRLWAPSYEPSGRMWAGIGRRIAPQEYAQLDVASARRGFAEVWSGNMNYVETLFAFAERVAPAVGASKNSATHIGFCGAPFLVTTDWNELVSHDVRVLSSDTPLPVWLALISFRSIVNCMDALNYWIVHKLLRAYAKRAGVQVQTVDSIAVGREPARAWGALGLDDACDALPSPGLGHTMFDANLFGATHALADSLAAVYSGDPLYEAANRADEWADEAAAAADIQRLLDLYIAYWRSLAHIHFDTNGPLETEIAMRALKVARLADRADTRTFEQRFSQSFLHEHIRFRSYSFERAGNDLDTYVGALERLIRLPCAPYFVHAALLYLERCVDSQSKWFDSYLPLAQSALYATLRSAAFRGMLATNGFDARLDRLEKLDAEIAVRAQERAYPTGKH